MLLKVQFLSPLQLIIAYNTWWTFDHCRAEPPTFLQIDIVLTPTIWIVLIKHFDASSHLLSNERIRNFPHVMYNSLVQYYLRRLEIVRCSQKICPLKLLQRNYCICVCSVKVWLRLQSPHHSNSEEQHQYIQQTHTQEISECMDSIFKTHIKQQSIFKTDYKLPALIYAFLFKFITSELMVFKYLKLHQHWNMDCGPKKIKNKRSSQVTHQKPRICHLMYLTWWSPLSTPPSSIHTQSHTQ